VSQREEKIKKSRTLSALSAEKIFLPAKNDAHIVDQNFNSNIL
jgi:hypothetical protein